jgi:hypothetical protein
MSTLSRRNGRRQAFGTGSVQQFVVVPDTRVSNHESGTVVEVAGGAVHARAVRRRGMSNNTRLKMTFGRPAVSPQSTLDMEFRPGSGTYAGTGRHPGPLYEVTAMDLALAA